MRQARAAAWLLALVLGSAARADDRVAVQVDPRVELLSVLYHLAGNPEYADPSPTSFLAAADAWFAPYADHPAVVASRRLHRRCGVAYNAPADLAAHLAGVDELVLRVPLEPWPEHLDDRWKCADLDRYLRKVGRFVDDSHFEDFLYTQRDFIRQVEQRYETWLEGEDIIPWFEQLFGPQPGTTFTLVPGLLAAPNNYGVAVLGPGGLQLRPVQGASRADEDGVPQVGDYTRGLLVHELGHPFAGPLLEAHRDELVPVERELVAPVRAQLRRQAHGGLVEASGRKLFYTGDIRAHVRKGSLFERLIRTPPQDLHVLLMEGTHIRPDGDRSAGPTEQGVERACIATFEATPGVALVPCPARTSIAS